jgi:hypothetical protein
MCTTDFKTFTDLVDSVSVPVGHKHGTIFKVTKKQLAQLLQAAGQTEGAKHE